MSDTRSDFRLLVAEYAVGILEDIVRLRRIPAPIDWGRAGSLVREARGLVKRLRFSFMPATMLARSGEALKLRDVAKSLATVLLPRDWVERLRGDRRAQLPIAECRWAIRTLYTLPARLALGDENDALYAVDLECVKVVSVQKLAGAERLWVTKASGVYAYTIVTNIESIKAGEVRAAAILPPREFMGVVSEAMYCSAPLQGCEPGSRPPLSAVERGEVEAAVRRIAATVRS